MFYQNSAVITFFNRIGLCISFLFTKFILALIGLTASFDDIKSILFLQILRNNRNSTPPQIGDDIVPAKSLLIGSIAQMWTLNELKSSSESFRFRLKSTTHHRLHVPLVLNPSLVKFISLKCMMQLSVDSWIH